MRRRATEDGSLVGGTLFGLVLSIPLWLMVVRDLVLPIARHWLHQ